MKFVDSWGSLILDHFSVARSTFILGGSMQAANFKANEILASILERIGSRPSEVNFEVFCPFNYIGATTRTDSKKELIGVGCWMGETSWLKAERHSSTNCIGPTDGVYTQLIHWTYLE